MAHSKQARKRVRQQDKRRFRNKVTASSMRTQVKRVLTAVEAGDKEAANSVLPMALKRIDKAAKTRVIHANTAARKKSRLMHAINSMG